MRKTLFVVIALVLVSSLLLAACGGSAAPAVNTPADNNQPAQDQPAADAPASDDDRVVIRWFVGLGTGTDPAQMPGQEALVEAFNASQDKITLQVEFIDNEQAPDQLKTQIAAGNAPDIIGPVGQSGTNEFAGLFLDLEPYLEGFDWSDFEADSIDAYRIEGEGLLGIPFAVYPSMIFYNRDLFDEAGLAYPPHVYGEPYADGDAWTVEKLEELAMQLTVDAGGNDANSADFDPENIVQFGYFTQWTLPRGEVTALFGSNSLVADDGSAQMPEIWREGFQWYYDGMHTKHFIPNQAYENSDLLAAGNVFDSGNIAMVHCHLWYVCCNGSVPNWDMAVVPSYNDNGDVTVKLHADTFRILNSTEHPEEAVEVLKWLTGEAAGDLLGIYDGMPARQSLQEPYFQSKDEQFTQGVDWEVAVAGLAYPDIPNHESNLPNYSKAFDRLEAFQSLYHSDPELDLNAELDKLISDLDAIFKE